MIQNTIKHVNQKLHRKFRTLDPDRRASPTHTLGQSPKKSFFYPFPNIYFGTSSYETKAAAVAATAVFQ